MKRTIHVLTLLLMLAVTAMTCGCGGNQSKKNESTKAQSYDGTYYWENMMFSQTVVISGDRWSSTNVVSDEVTYEHGSVRGNYIYDSSGYLQIGRISGKTIVWGNHTLRKQ